MTLKFETSAGRAAAGWLPPSHQCDLREAMSSSRFYQMQLEPAPVAILCRVQTPVPVAVCRNLLHLLLMPPLYVAMFWLILARLRFPEMGAQATRYQRKLDPKQPRPKPLLPKPKPVLAKPKPQLPKPKKKMKQKKLSFFFKKASWMKSFCHFFSCMYMGVFLGRPLSPPLSTYYRAFCQKYRNYTL